ncbi:YitT family protein [Luteolibacter pohnpeiensis]|uniref:YitT family protein n=1 Tax=Luteolibacter pohnpeiensis TaxID=454153 RepID=A0A934VWY6_9BACT|nr:YitT family protein [Luteolibacter pohnpeiensis]MBK1883009.1 YitT family protein [Luteolibacter pohnpeiensis]
MTLKTSDWLSSRHPVLECLGTCVAGLLYAVALKYFVFPSKIILTGFEGLAAATAYYFEKNSLFLWLYGISQLILIVFAFFKISRGFALRTMLTVSTVLLGLAFLPFLEFADPGSSNERILLVLFGGILAGLAKAVSLRLRGSTGDEDILAAWFAMRYLKPVGTIAVGAAAVSTIYGLILEFLKSGSIEPVVNTLMYTSIYIFASAETLNNFFRKFKLVLLTVFGNDPKRLGNAITAAAPHRTYTIHQATGGFSSDSVHLIRTVITHEELPEILDGIQKACPDAFWFHHDIEGISRRYYIKPIG